MNTNVTEIGKVRMFIEKAGYGFIVPQGVDMNVRQFDLIVHHSNIIGTDKMLWEGDRVEYVPVKGEKGMVAKRVRRIT